MQMKIGKNIRLCTDGRYEARYKKGRDENGKIKEIVMGELKKLLKKEIFN